VGRWFGSVERSRRRDETLEVYYRSTAASTIAIHGSLKAGRRKGRGCGIARNFDGKQRNAEDAGSSRYLDYKKRGRFRLSMLIQQPKSKSNRVGLPRPDRRIFRGEEGDGLSARTLRGMGDGTRDCPQGWRFTDQKIPRPPLAPPPAR